MRRKHEMPFGAEIRDDGNVRFRLWAPSCESVSLRLSSHGTPEIELEPAGDGWFEIITSASAGDQYQFRVNRERLVPDPGSRFQPAGVHGRSEVIDPAQYQWQDSEWLGRVWEKAVLYEMHVGTFTREGTFAAAESKLDYLAELGITAVEVMPVSQFPGKRNWGYDGVLPYAPANAYGRPDDLKHFVDVAHAKGLMVFLDVVYNHFGPEGNYLPLYAPQFFTDRHKTPWGQAINFDGAFSRTVRDFFIHNVLYWLEEYHFDGLRLDAVHAIKDDSRPDMLEELATQVHDALACDRHLHLVLENDHNATRYLQRTSEHRPRFYTAQWNDDFHHAAHVLATGENDGYYQDYSSKPEWHLGRCLAEGFSFQGEASVYRSGQPRGEPCTGLPATAFVSFLQNHDQVGNRAFGERLIRLCDADTLKALVAVMLLAPSPPLLFMGEEFGANTPFLFFCDFEPDLAAKVTQGRRSEFGDHKEFRSPPAQAKIPDPSSESTFLSSKLDWNSLTKVGHLEWLQFYRNLLHLRQKEIVPLLQRLAPERANFEVLSHGTVSVRWPFHDNGALALLANFSKAEIRIPECPKARILYPLGTVFEGISPAQSVIWFLEE